MRVEIENYKNINKLQFEIEENKVNHIFGISGSGKSSIANALTKEISENDIKIGKQSNNVKILVNNQQSNYKEYATFNLEKTEQLLINDTENEEIYKILFSNDDKLLKAKHNFEETIKEFNILKNELISYKSNIELIEKHFDIKLNMDGTINKKSKFLKLENELSQAKNKMFLNVIKKYDVNYIDWIKKGKIYQEQDNICPYCNNKISTRKQTFIAKMMNLTPKNFEIITKDNDYLEKINIKKPNYLHSREVEGQNAK